MPRNILKKLLFSVLVLIVLMPVLWIGFVQALTHHAKNKAQSIIQSAYAEHNHDTDDDKIIALTETVFTRFNHDKPSHSLFLRLRPYVTNKRLPVLLRIPNGVIETEIETGLCDNAARMLAFLLEQENFSSVQWNMVSDRAGHSALLVTTNDEREGFVDPFYGYTAQNSDGKLTSTSAAQNLLRNGHSFDSIFIPINENSQPKFYKDFTKTMMAAEGQDLRIEVTLPKINGDEPLVIGEMNGRPDDVRRGTMKLDMTPYWQYMGHRYNREWVRVLTASEPVEITFSLTAPVEQNILIATPAPTINGNDLSWTLNEGDQIIFQDGLAKISLKRMNSYIDVDQITVRKIN